MTDINDKNKLISYELGMLMDKLPKKMRFDYVLCESTDDLFSKAAKMQKVYPSQMKRTVRRQIGTKMYRQFLEKYETKAPAPSNSVSDKKPILGLALCDWRARPFPILLNSGEMTHAKVIIFVYLHEAGHLLGLKRKDPDLYSESIADEIALHWYRKIYLRRKKVLAR
ncbi:MAG: hypothetical protein ACKVP0_10700 [Pirellulaceae bacterium]